MARRKPASAPSTPAHDQRPVVPHHAKPGPDRLPEPPPMIAPAPRVAPAPVEARAPVPAPGYREVSNCLTLLITGPNGKEERRFDGPRPIIRIGKNANSDLRIDDPTASRMHAVIELIDGQFQIFDLGSTHGTFVNGERTNKSTLYLGDTITVGDTTLKVVGMEKGYAPGAEARAPAPTPSRTQASTRHDASLSVGQMVPLARPARDVEREQRKAEMEELLLRAAIDGDLEYARDALVNGASPDTRNVKGPTVLHIASHRNHVAIVELLLEKNADPNLRDEEGNTPLMHAASVEIARALVERGARIDAINDAGWDALDIARGDNNKEVAAFLKSQGAGTSIPKVRRAGVSGFLAGLLVSIALIGGAVIARDKIIAKRQANDRFDTALLMAVTQERSPVMEDTARHLLAHGINVNLKDRNGWTPLMNTAHSGDVVVAGMLLRAGADINARNSFGTTALGVARQHNHHAMITYLREKGAKE